MSGPKDYMASNVSPPRAGGVQNVAVTTTGGTAATALASGVIRRFVDVMAIGDDIEFLFGDSTVTVDFTTSTGQRLADGERVPYCLERGDTHVAAESGTGNATLKIVASSPPEAPI